MALPYDESLLEAVGVNVAGVHLEHIAPWPSLQLRRLGEEQLAQLGYVGLHRSRGTVGAVIPQLLDQPIGAYRLASMDHQARQQTPALSTAQVEGPVRAEDLERAKDPKLHRHPLPRPSGRASRRVDRSLAPQLSAADRVPRRTALADAVATLRIPPIVLPRGRDVQICASVMALQLVRWSASVADEVESYRLVVVTQDEDHAVLGGPSVGHEEELAPRVLEQP